MFKFTDSSDNEVWLKPSCIESVEHVRSETEHTIRIGSNVNVFFYEPETEEDCRQFLHDLFKAMDHEYKYQG